MSALPSARVDRAYEQVFTCELCGAAAGGSIRVLLPNSRLMACDACGCWTLLPRGTRGGQVALHDSPRYFEHPYFELRRAADAAARRRCQRILARLSAYIDTDTLRGQRLLDVGCDTGSLLHWMREDFGMVPVGIDVAGRAVSAAAKRGLEAYQIDLEGAPEHLRDFPLITAIDLIEHVADPGAFLREISKRLRPGGLVYLETPNIQSTVYRLGETLCRLTQGHPSSVFERLFPPEHIQYFSPSGLTRLARASNLDPVQMDTRTLPASDIAAGWLVRSGMATLQALDRVAGTGILLCTLLQRKLS
jgi:SAM-dependent methyltransferase